MMELSVTERNLDGAAVREKREELCVRRIILGCAGREIVVLPRVIMDVRLQN